MAPKNVWIVVFWYGKKDKEEFQIVEVIVFFFKKSYFNLVNGWQVESPIYSAKET